MKRFLALIAMSSVLMGTSAAPASFTPADQTRILNAADTALGAYTFPDKIAPLRNMLDTNRAKYVTLTDPKAFAGAVTDDLYAIAHDKHLRLMYFDTPVPNDVRPTAADVAHRQALRAYHGYGLGGVAILPANVGLLRLANFDTMPDSKAMIDGAMAVLAHTDALIVDLRHNGGGDPDSLDYMMGYFFAKPVELTSLHMISNGVDKVMKQFSAANVSGTRYLNNPIYVLTSSKTFSCAEQFTYDMKTLHRATIVGETTGGGANPGEFVRLDDHFGMFVPTGRAENPYTHTNWEGTGIKPDVAVDASSALTEAYTRALHAIDNPLPEAVMARNKALADPSAAVAAAGT